MHLQKMTGSFACDIKRDSNYIADHAMCQRCGLYVSETLTSLILETQKKHNFTHIFASATAFGKVSETKHLCVSGSLHRGSGQGLLRGWLLEVG